MSFPPWEGTRRDREPTGSLGRVKCAGVLHRACQGVCAVRTARQSARSSVQTGKVCCCIPETRLSTVRLPATPQTPSRSSACLPNRDSPRCHSHRIRVSGTEEIDSTPGTTCEPNFMVLVNQKYLYPNTIKIVFKITHS